MIHPLTQIGWNQSRILFDLDPKKAYALRSPCRVYSRQAPSGPCWRFGTVPHGMSAQFPGAMADSTPGAGDAALCGILIHGPWAGPTRHNWFIK